MSALSSDITTLDLLSAVIATVSFVVSMFVLATQWWSKREASVGVILVEDHRLIIRNYGPHHADDVNVEIQDRRGGEDSTVTAVTQGEPDLPIPRLHAGELYRIPGYYVTVGGQRPRAVVSWGDGRRERQERTVYLSVQREPRP